MASGEQGKPGAGWGGEESIMYEIFEHTADMGLRVRGATLNELFAEAGRGLASMLIENSERVRPLEARTFQIDANDRVDLMVDWLSQLLNCLLIDDFIFVQFTVRVSENGLWAEARGERVDPDRHRLDLDIKAITYHRLRVEEEDGGWVAEVIMDI
jgi:SHS2 domain-containing protein